MCGKPYFKPVECRVDELMGKLPRDCTAILSIFAGGVFWETPQEFADNMGSHDERLCEHRLERLLEVRAYSDAEELHVWRDAIGTKAELHGRIVCDKGILADYYMDEDDEKDGESHFLDIDVSRSNAIREQEGNDCLYMTMGGGRYVLPGSDYTKVRIRNYLDYDEDGICRVVDFRILGLSRGRKTLEPMTLEDLLREKSEDLNLKLRGKRNHPVAKGDLSETKWRSFLRSFLPNRYAVTKGFVFDSIGGVSQEIDVIVYDPFHSPLIHEDKEEGRVVRRYVTAESVYAVFEVKQTANKQHVEYADKMIESVRALKRTSRGMIASGKQVPARPLTHIIGGLLTADAMDAPTSIDNLKKLISCSDNIDIVCSASLGTFHRRGAGVNSIEVSSPKESVFAFFYVLLDELFKLGTVSAIDIRDYADKSLKDFRLQRGEL